MNYYDIYNILPSGKLTWQWKMDLLKMYSLLKNGDFLLPCYFTGGYRSMAQNDEVSKLEGWMNWMGSPMLPKN